MNKKYLILFFFIFLLSRLYFANSQAVFFDSPEYLTRLSDNNLLNALSSGHLPLHPGYIMIFWPVYHLAQTFQLPPSFSVIFIQAILAFFGICCFYQIIKNLFDKNIALKSSIIASIIPIFWISNSTIMMETTYVSFFLFSFYFFIKYFNLKYAKILYLFLGIIFLILSFTTHLIVILWIPLIIYSVYRTKPENTYKSIIYLLIAVALGGVVNGHFISILIKSGIINGIFQLFSSKFGEHANLSFSLSSVLIFLRNFTIPLLRNNTLLLTLLSFVFIVYSYLRNKKLFIILIFWIFPALITNQWWDSLLYGRHSLIASFGIALSVGFTLGKKRLLYYSVIAYLLISTVPTLQLLKKDTPYIIEAQAVKNLPQNGLFIESHFARPQLDKVYRGKTIFVEEPGWSKEALNKEIIDNLESKKPVFISSQALSEPYGLYSGPYLHVLSLSYKKEYVLKPLVRNFAIQEYKQIDFNDNLSIYKIISGHSTQYPKIQNLKYSKHRIDYNDPLIKIWLLVNKEH
ncbi:MAG: hypothetical protein A2857_01255 [Candidatus Levybacteria bacterium RIFCSPHIGHO2_01_FULL_36_15]|nr:MAG: hypothetical protein A2857_01255 [Candidatus Levybacteria bacterium RIFCSPHIGHO2_01_FULL_36_15]